MRSPGDDADRPRALRAKPSRSAPAAGPRPYVLFAIPCFNEAQNLGGLLERFVEVNRLHGASFETRVAIVDDGSVDNPAGVVERFLPCLSVRTLKHPRNLGLSAAVNTAFREFHAAVTSADAPIAVGIMDGDDSHNPLTIPAMLDRIVAGHDVVVASRYRYGSVVVGVVWWRQVLSAGMALLFKAVRNITGIRDYSCGFRMYSPAAVRALDARYGENVVTRPSFACTVELLRRCASVGCLMTEVPLVLRYDRKRGESKLPFGRTIVQTLGVLLSRM